MSSTLNPTSAADTSEPATAEPVYHGPQELVWSNAFHTLGTTFFTEQIAQPVPAPYWVAASDDCAARIGLPQDWQSKPDLHSLEVFAGNARWRGMRPLSSVYSGHQFGVWAGQLGDGRALWLGEAISPEGPLELQLKGAGRTPYSRGGDGRAVLRSSIREYLCSEAMAALGIPTTRALCVIGTDMRVRREEIETGAVVARAAESFIRFGHFEHFANTAPGTKDAPYAALRQLADFVIDHYYPEARDAQRPCAAMLEAVSKRTAELMAAWQSVGFCHGVMNTDNMSILGLTIDYGPFGFLDQFDPNHICNHTDEQGRYAYSRQPNIGYWNLLALGQALLPLIEDTDAAIAAIDTYKGAFSAALQRRMNAKVGFAQSQPGDQQLIEDLLALMATDHVDFTIAFRRLSTFDSSQARLRGGVPGGQNGAPNQPCRDLFIDRDKFDAWALLYGARLRSENSVDAERLLRMNAVNPKFILRNHLGETAIEKARGGDYGEVRKLKAILDKPFDEQPENAAYADFPPEWAQHIEVSCSS